MAEIKKLNLAIIGQGRSGRNIHGKYYISDDNIYYNVRYVVENDAALREEALTRYPGCEVLSDYKGLFDKKDIDLVVNSTYSETHYNITKEFLEHKFNVLVEKPMARNRYECKDLIKTAKDNDVVLSVFQQTFYAPYYQYIKEKIESGIFGKIEQISIRFSGFARRWDWQTLQKKLAGNAYNPGPHPIGIAYGLLDFDKAAKVVYSRLAKTELSSGDAEDYVKMLISAPNKPLVDIEISSADAFSNYNVKIQGSKGGLKATAEKCEVKYIKDGENTERSVIFESMKDENGVPAYCKDNLIIHEESTEFTGTAFDVGTATLYKELYFKLTEGKKMYIEPENATMIVGAIEQLHAENPLPLIY